MKYNLKFKLSPAFKKTWLAALRSGKYKQGREYLHSDNKFCCLGVAYDARGGKWNDYNETLIGQCDKLLSQFIGDKPPVPKNVMRVLEQINNNQTVEDYLIKLNDNKEWSFKQIANWIEKHL